MSTDEQDPKTGGVPHAFGNRLAWKWAPVMPAPCKGGFLTMLYALRQMAAPSGELRFNNAERKPLRITDLAKAAGCREKDGRRYIEAAIRAGVVAVVGERKRGKATLYQLILTPWPEWERAAAYLKATARTPEKGWPKDEPKDEQADSSGHGGPNSEEQNNGPQGPELPDEGADGVRATGARPSSGHGGPMGSGHGGPNKPCVSHAGNHEMADVVGPLRVRAGARSENDQRPHQQVDDSAPFGRCDHCLKPHPRPDRIVCHGCESLAAEAQEDHQKPVQGVFLMPVPAGPALGLPDAPGALPAPRENPADPLRICRCGRKFHGPVTGKCLDCRHAERDEQLRAVGGA